MKKSLPPGTIKSITCDRGKEFAWYKKIEEDLKIPVYFADPHSPWQKATVENLNGLARDFFPKGTYFSKVTPQEVRKAVRSINIRPKKILDWDTSQECFKVCCLSA